MIATHTASSSIARVSSGTKPISKPEKVLLVDCLQYLYHRQLKNLVFQRSDAQRPLPAITLGYVGSQRGLGSIAIPVHAAVQVPQPVFQTFSVIRPRHTVHSRRSLQVQRPVRFS